jgi:Mg2+-importing ATPase
MGQHESLHLEEEWWKNQPEAIIWKLNSSSKGLSDEDVKKRREQYGWNHAVVHKDRALLLRFLLNFKNPLVLLLLGVALLSMILGEKISALLVMGMAFISVVLSFVQEYKATEEAKKLSELVATKTTVMRNGQESKVNVRELVPGDIVVLSAGDIVPADMRIITAKDLYVHQASLTGEPFPLEKTSESLDHAEELGSISNMVFMGSDVTSGAGQGIVVKTGKDTQFGQLAEHVGATQTKTAFDTGMAGFVTLMLRIVIILALAVFGLNYLLKGDWLLSLLFALSVAIGLAPEMLPMIITVNLSKGAIAMSKKHVVVKRLSAIQNFGAMDVLCSDKTGTLTLGRVVLEKHFDLSGGENIDVLKYAYLNSYHQTGLKNVLDQAILKYEHFKVDEVKKVDEIPFDFERRIMSVVVEQNNCHTLIAKGAPEELVKRCGKFLLRGKVGRKNPGVEKNLMDQANAYRSEGFRVLAVAYKEFAAPKKNYTKEDESDLVLVGFIIFLDPPNPTAKEAIADLKNLGITLKILTGDNEIVTRKVCQEVGLDSQGFITGDLIDKLSDPELQLAVEDKTIFARLNPLQKERVIQALKKNGHTIGYLGDGINDAPSFKQADVGISVHNAADIAKETADIILLKHSLTVLADGIVEGRKTYANILKYMKMSASSNFGNMFSMTGASIILPFFPLLPLQVLLNNFLYDMSQVAIPTDDVDQEDVKKPTPWDVKYIRRYLIFFGLVSSFFDFVTFIILIILHVEPPLFWTLWFLESLITQTLVIYVIRTRKIPFFESKPSWYLALNSLFIIVLALLVVYSPLADFFHFTRPSLFMLVMIFGIVLVYLVVVQALKVWFIKKWGYE